MVEQRSVWLATAELPAYEALRSDEQADVVVVGGGLIGLTTALFLAQEGATVVLLEAKRLGLRTSGHTTGKVTSQHGARYASLFDRHGFDKARRYARANQAAVDEVASLVDRFGISCELVRTPAYVYSTRSDNGLRREADIAAALGLPAQLADPAEVGVPAAAAVRFDAQVQLHPAQYLAGLAAAVTATGGRIYEHSRALSVDDSSDGVEVTTADGSVVRARHAVIATLLPFGVTGGYFARTRPSQSHGVALRLPVQAPAGMAISADSPVRSTRPWPGGGPTGLIVVGGGHETGDGSDVDARYQSLLDWVGSVWSFTAQPLYRWSAEDYSTADQLPYIGRSAGSRSIFVATGMHKWGLSNGTAAAGLLRDLISGRPNPAADLYDARRLGDPRAVGKLITDNLKVGKEFTAGRFARAVHGALDHLEVGEGGLVEVDGTRVGGYRDEGGGLHTVKPVCTHLGCPLRWNAADTTWDCNCHGSRFTATGEVLDGPATKPLEPGK